MALQKQSLNINFSSGLDTKTDPFQVPAGKFLTLENSVFDKAGMLTKRNGYQKLSSLPDSSSKFVTTFNGNLTAIGNKLEAFSVSNNTWIDKGTLQPVAVDTLSIVRSNTNQIQADSAVASNGLVCTVYTDSTPSGIVYKYVVADSTTGQNIVASTPISDADPATGTPRVFLVGNYFVIVYTRLISAAYHLSYMTVGVGNPLVVSSPVDIASSYIPAPTLAFDALEIAGRLFVAYNTAAGGQAIKVTYINPTSGVPVTANTFAGEIATMFSLAADETNPSNPTIYVSYYDLASTTAKVLAISLNLGTILSPTLVFSSRTLLNLSSTAQSGSVTVFAEVSSAYAYNSSIPTNYITSTNITQTGTVGSTVVVVRSVGLASKAFTDNGISYFLAVYSSPFQPSYFLISDAGNVIAKLAYSNAGPYYTTGLPNYSVNNGIYQIPYLFKDLVQAANKSQGLSNPTGVYAQLGVNLASFDLSVSQITSAEIGANLNISGGFIAAYDGVKPVEQEFFLWPDSVQVGGDTGGSMTPQQYFYQVTYEWADNQGNLFRSAPSVPMSVTLSLNTSVDVYIPTLRLTYKIDSPVKIVIYRWSTGQQTYYQTTSITSPLLNDPSVDYIFYNDKLPDSAIIGNNILYTTGGVIENISPPASDLLTLFNNRLWLVDAEDKNLLWFSKQIIEATPVEMSDLLTLYVAPTTGSQGSTGHITAIAPMDDKLIVYKNNALGYISGVGPDNTGNNNQYSDFNLITSVVGCTNQASIVFTPQGLMFQSSKGIWLLGRDLSTNFIGAPVEGLTDGALVQSAVNIPNTNQVRFTLNTGITLMYDYYYNQWGTFTKVPAISSTLYQDAHTYINSIGQVFQELEGSYVDGGSPVLMAYTTSWINIAGIQGYERFYQMYMLGNYLSPFKLNVQFAYDYNPSYTQAIQVTPNKPAKAWGKDELWGSGSPWGGQPSVFEARLFPTTQKCESFQVAMNEVFDASVGDMPGAGLTLSGMNLIVGVKKGYRTSSASRSFG